ncbi:MAG: four helix bundle protein [Verrucomicrobia bacterium]|nr:four helix bundle protein [Verrucomicrobiota bacterium]
MSFAHEKLSVYEKAIEFLERIQLFLETWSNRHAFVDHLSRAAESILFNLAEAVRMKTGKKKILTLEYAIGSGFECAACFDIAVLKGLLDVADAVSIKRDLLRICKMLVGLRNSWMESRVAEERESYAEDQGDGGEKSVFYHESLDVYRVSLEFYRWLLTADVVKSLGAAFGKEMDVLATRIVLNVAESNGRYSELSRESFLQTANAATIKLAVSLDIGVRRGVWTESELVQGKNLLLRISQMTAPRDYLD